MLNRADTDTPPWRQWDGEDVTDPIPDPSLSGPLPPLDPLWLATAVAWILLLMFVHMLDEYLRQAH